MSKHVSLLLVAFCLGAAAVVGLSAGAGAPAANSARPMGWRHMALEHEAGQIAADQDLARRIDKLGADGWELVDVERFVDDDEIEKTVFYFKKPR